MDEAYSKGAYLTSLCMLLSNADNLGIPCSIQKEILYKILNVIDAKSGQNEIERIGYFYSRKEQYNDLEKANIEKQFRERFDYFYKHGRMPESESKGEEAHA